MHIKKFTLNNTTNSLVITFDDQTEYTFTYEFLRVFSPIEMSKSKGNAPEVYHKKLTVLNKIESIGKHGYRFIFDDGHADSYNNEHLKMLTENNQQLWSLYLSSVNKVANSREGAINIQQL